MIRISNCRVALLVLSLIANVDLAAQQNKKLKAELDSIYKTDQLYRMMEDSIRTTFGFNSKEYMELMHKLAATDSSNLARVAEIIERYGWPGVSAVGERDNSAVFPVIQHGDVNTQEKYLGALRKSVTAGESKAIHLGYLEDRIAIRTGRK